jgi:hypothetical protein
MPEVNPVPMSSDERRTVKRAINEIDGLDSLWTHEKIHWSDYEATRINILRKVFAAGVTQSTKGGPNANDLEVGKAIPSSASR